MSTTAKPDPRPAEPPETAPADPSPAHEGNVARPHAGPENDAPADTDTPGKDAKKDKVSAAKSTGTTTAEERMVPGGPTLATAATGTVLAAGVAAQVGAGVAGPVGAVVGAGVVVLGAAALGSAALAGNRASRRASRRDPHTTRGGPNAYHGARSGGLALGKAARANRRRGLDPRGNPLPAGNPPGKGLRAKMANRRAADRTAALTTGAASGAIPAKGSSVKGAGKLTRATRQARLAQAGGLPYRPARQARPGGGMGGSVTPGRLRAVAGRPGSSVSPRPGHPKMTAKALKAAAAVKRHHAVNPSSKAGRAAHIAGRGATAPFKAFGAGVDGLRKGGGPLAAASAARRRAIKDHRARHNLHKRTRHPFRGWGSAATGFGLAAGKKAGNGFLRMWRWNPWNEEQAAMDAADAAAAATRQDQQTTGSKPGVITESATPAPTANTSSTRNEPTPAQPERIRPPVQPTAPTHGGNPMNGNESGVPTIQQLIHLSEEIRRMAGRRAQPGTRPGILECIEDSKGWGIILDNIAKAAKEEAAAWHRFGVHASIPAMYDAVLKTTENAAAAMVGIPGTIERIERDRLDALRNPPKNAQMFDQVANGYRAGQG